MIRNRNFHYSRRITLTVFSSNRLCRLELQHRHTPRSRGRTRTKQPRRSSPRCNQTNSRHRRGIYRRKRPRVPAEPTEDYSSPIASNSSCFFTGTQPPLDTTQQNTTSSTWQHLLPQHCTTAKKEKKKKKWCCVGGIIASYPCTLPLLQPPNDL